MSRTKIMKAQFKNQQWTLMALLILIGTIQFFLSPEDLTGELFSISAVVWFWIAIVVPVVHQLYVWWVWRWELYSQSFTKRLGLQKAFRLYSVGFSILFGGRLVSIILLSLATKETLSIAPWVAYSLTALFIPLVLFLFYSVHRYFGMDRAYGIDHFDREYNKPFEKKGIFRYTNNGMYSVGFLVLYIPGLLAFSGPTLLVALFNHLYIWVHFYTTEQPDMRIIYGSAPSEKE